MTHAGKIVAARRIRAGMFALLTVVATATPGAQQNQVTFFLSATTPTGEPVADLKPEDITIAEDGKPSNVLTVVPVNWPVKVTVLLDNGFDTGQLLSPYRSGLKALLAALPGGVEASVVTLAPQPRWLIRSTSDAGQLQKGVDRLVTEQAPSRVIEGLIEAASRVEQDNRKQVVNFPVIVLVSTTGAEGSTARDQEVKRMAERLLTYPARVHVIMLNTGATSPNTLIGARQVHVGKSIADLTGGRYEGIAAATRIPSLLGEFAHMISDAHAFQSRQYMVTVQRPAGATGQVGQMGAAAKRVGIRLTPTAQGLKP